MTKKSSFSWLISNSPHDNVGELGGEFEMSELEMSLLYQVHQNHHHCNQDHHNNNIQRTSNKHTT